MYYTFTLSKIYPGKNGEHNVIGIGYELTPDGKDISAIYYLDSMTHEQDPVYGGLKKVTPEELLEAMAACEEPNYAWEENDELKNRIRRKVRGNINEKLF